MPEEMGSRLPSRGQEPPDEDPRRRAPFSSSGTEVRVGIPHPGPDPSFRAALASRDFTLLWLGQFGSEVGNGLVQLALPLLVYAITGSAIQMAGAYIFQFLPWLLFGLLGGVLVDRWDRRITIVVVELVRAVAFLSVGIAFAIDSDILTVQMIYALIFMESSLQNFFNPARLALMPNLVKAEDLRAGNSLMEVSRHIGFLVAPSAGVALADYLGAATIIIIDGVTFAISGLTVFMIRWRQPKRIVERVEGWRQQLAQVYRETSEGITVIRTVRLLQVTILLGFALNLVVAPIQTLLPLYVFDVKEQPQAYFALLALTFIVGLLVGSLAAPAISKRAGLGKMTIGSVIVLGATISVAAYLPTLIVPIGALVVAGIAIGALNVGQMNMLQTSTTDEERGRVSAAYYSVTLGVRTAGYAVAGALVAPLGIQPLFVVFGVIVLCLGLFLIRVPEIRDHV